jgi:predicted nucleic acid-binding protein
MKLAYIDSSVWIARVEGLPKYREILNAELAALLQDGWVFCVSDAVLLEVLAKPYKQNQTDVIAVYRRVFGKTRLLKTPTDIFSNALLVIQAEPMNAMDAVHVGLALHHHCQCIVSTDRHFRELKAITPMWIDLRS